MLQRTNDVLSADILAQAMAAIRTPQKRRITPTLISTSVTGARLDHADENARLDQSEDNDQLGQSTVEKVTIPVSDRMTCGCTHVSNFPDT